MVIALRATGIGLLAGALTAVPAVGFLVMCHRQLPLEEQYPLPQRLILQNLCSRADCLAKRTESQLASLSLVLDVAYKAICATLYPAFGAAVRSRLSLSVGPTHSAALGAGYGALVWAVSYGIFFPAGRLLAFPTKVPFRRNLLMIVSHALWGVGLAVLVDRLSLTN